MKHNEWDKLRVAAEADAKLHRNNSCDIQSPRCDLKAAILSGNLISRGDNTAISYLSRAERRWICLEAIAPKGALTFRRVYHRCVIFFFSSKCMSPFRPKSPPAHWWGVKGTGHPKKKQSLSKVLYPSKHFKHSPEQLRQTKTRKHFMDGFSKPWGLKVMWKDVTDALFKAKIFTVAS